MERRMFDDRAGGATAGNTQVVATSAAVATSQPGAMIMQQGTVRSSTSGGGAQNGAGGALRAPAEGYSYSWQQHLGMQAMERTSDAPYEAHHMYYAHDMFGAVTLETAPHPGKTPLLEHPHQEAGGVKAPQMVCLKPALLHEAPPTTTAPHHLQQPHHHHPHHPHPPHHHQHLQQPQQMVAGGSNVLVVTGGTGLTVMPPTNAPLGNGAPMEGGAHLQVLGGAQAAPLAPPAPTPTTPTTNKTNNKKKKKVVKSKKKQIKEGEDAEAVECAVYDDDLVYIRGGAGSGRHTADISGRALDQKALRLLCPLPPPAPQQGAESDDEFKSLAGVGVWEYGKVWNHHLTIKFLECLHRNKKRMFSRDSRRLLYMELSALFQREDHKEISTEELEKKWCSLLSSYKRNQNRLRSGEEVSWSYYKIMDDIMVEGRHIRRQNRERPKRGGARGRRLTDDEAELRGVKGVCRRKSKRLKQQLQERLERVRRERGRCLQESSARWEGVKESIAGITRDIAMLNSSVVMLGHTMSSFLAALDRVDRVKKEAAVCDLCLCWVLCGVCDLCCVGCGVCVVLCSATPCLPSWQPSTGSRRRLQSERLVLLFCVVLCTV